VCDYRSGAYESILADVMAADNGDISSDTGAFFDCGFSIFTFACDKSAGIHYICKYTGWPEKNIIFAEHARIQRYIVFNFDVISNENTALDETVLSNIAVKSDLCAGHNM